TGVGCNAGCRSRQRVFGVLGGLQSRAGDLRGGGERATQCHRCAEHHGGHTLGDLRQHSRAGIERGRPGQAGCRLQFSSPEMNPFFANSPSLDVVGSYFPAWMACIILGLALTFITRQVLICFKLNAYLRVAPVVYVCVLISWTLVVWLVCYKN